MWLSYRDLPLQVGSLKLAPRFVGPFLVERVVNPSAVCLKLTASLPVHPMFHGSQLKPVSSSELSPPAEPPPPTRLIDNDPVYTVSKILDVCCRGRGFQFLVDWEGYDPEEHLWVSQAFILDHSLLRDFYREFPHKPGRALRGAYCYDLCCCGWGYCFVPVTEVCWRPGGVGGRRRECSLTHAPAAG